MELPVRGYRIQVRSCSGREHRLFDRRHDPTARTHSPPPVGGVSRSGDVGVTDRGNHARTDLEVWKFDRGIEPIRAMRTLERCGVNNPARPFEQRNEPPTADARRNEVPGSFGSRTDRDKTSTTTDLPKRENADQRVVRHNQDNTTGSTTLSGE